MKLNFFFLITRFMHWLCWCESTDEAPSLDLAPGSGPHDPTGQGTQSITLFFCTETWFTAVPRSVTSFQSLLQIRAKHKKTKERTLDSWNFGGTDKAKRQNRFREVHRLFLQVKARKRKRTAITSWIYDTSKVCCSNPSIRLVYWLCGKWYLFSLDKECKNSTVKRRMSNKMENAAESKEEEAMCVVLYSACPLFLVSTISI